MMPSYDGVFKIYPEGPPDPTMRMGNKAGRTAASWDTQTWDRSPRCGTRPSDVKPEQDHIAVPHNVFFSFGADQALFLGHGHRSAGDQIVVGDDLGADKAPLEIGVNFPRRLPGLSSPPGWSRPAPRAVPPSGRKSGRAAGNSPGSAGPGRKSPAQARRETGLFPPRPCRRSPLPFWRRWATPPHVQPRPVP